MSLLSKKKKKKSPIFVNKDMDKFKFDFRLFVPKENEAAMFEEIDKGIK